MGYPGLVAEREWSERVDLKMTRRVDWDLLRRTVLFAEERIPTPTNSRFEADLPDSTVRSQSFQDLRDAVEPEGSVGTELEMSIGDDRLRISWLLRLGFGGMEYSQITFRGPDRDRVLGAAAALRRELPGWRDENEKKADKANEKADKGEVVPNPARESTGLRRHLTNPNPWVLAIGAVVIGGLMLGLLTDWFGLAG